MINDFRSAKYKIDRFILNEMSLRRISHITIFNREATKSSKRVVDLNDDTDETPEEKKQKDIDFENSKAKECHMSDELLEEVRTHYEKLYFVFEQVEDTITITWS